MESAEVMGDIKAKGAAEDGLTHFCRIEHGFVMCIVVVHFGLIHKYQ